MRKLISKLTIDYYDSIIFIDGDNSLNQINLDFSPEKVYYVVFLSIHTKTKIEKRLRDNITFVTSETSVKDSCDICMCMYISTLHLRLPKDIRFRFVSSDHFIKELNIISELNRPIDIIFREEYISHFIPKFILKKSFDQIKNNRQLRCVLFVTDYVTISLNQMNELRYKESQTQVVFFTRKKNTFPHNSSDILINVDKKRDVIFSVAIISSMISNMIDNTVPFIILSSRILHSYDEILFTISQNRHIKVFDNICNPNFVYLMIHYLRKLNIDLTLSENMLQFTESIDYDFYFELVMKNRYILSYKSAEEAEVARKLLFRFENNYGLKKWFVNYYDLKLKTLDKWLNNMNVKSCLCYQAGEDYIKNEL